MQRTLRLDHFFELKKVLDITLTVTCDLVSDLNKNVTFTLLVLRIHKNFD